MEYGWVVVYVLIVGVSVFIELDGYVVCSSIFFMFVVFEVTLFCCTEFIFVDWLGLWVEFGLLLFGVVGFFMFR